MSGVTGLESKLESKYVWRTPVIVATVALLLCLALLIRNRPSGALSAGAIVVVLWLVFLAVVWRRTQALLAVDGPAILVRTFRRVHRIEGSDVVAVAESMTPTGASYRLTVRRPDGPTVRRGVPTALLRKGHSTLFAWILAWAPTAELDRGSQRTLADLQDRGLVIEGRSASPSPTRPPEEERARRV